MSTNPYKCRGCGITDGSKFYPSAPKKCKACTKKKASGYDRNPATSTRVNCLGLGCGKISNTPQDDFFISDATGLYLDKCKTCKGHNSPLKTSETSLPSQPSLPNPVLPLTLPLLPQNYTIPTDPIIRGTMQFTPSYENGVIVTADSDSLKKYQGLYAWVMNYQPKPTKEEYEMLETIFRRLRTEPS